MIRRARSLSPQAFQQAWLAAGVAAAAFPGLRHYRQNHALLSGYARGELIFDGFEEFDFVSPEALAIARASIDWSALALKMESYADPARSFLTIIDISVQKDDVPPPDAIRSTEFVNRRPDLPIAAFRRYWIEAHGPLASGIPQIIRYEQHHLNHSEYQSGTPRFDGWATTWFASTDAMRAAAAEPVYRETRADEPNFLAGPLPVLFTRERLSLTI
jgi:uncharacterized protein (TIGR02118 family)